VQGLTYGQGAAIGFWAGSVLGPDFLQITESFAGRKVWRVIVESLMELCRAVQRPQKPAVQVRQPGYPRAPPTTHSLRGCSASAVAGKSVLVLRVKPRWFSAGLRLIAEDTHTFDRFVGSRIGNKIG